MKKFRFAVASLTCVGLLASMPAMAAKVGAQHAQAKTITVGLVTDKGGLNDKSFNHLADVGLQKSVKVPGVKGSVLQAHTAADYEPNLTKFAQQKKSLIIAVGFLMENALYNVAKQFPNQKFAIIDGAPADAKGNIVNLPNVANLFFKPEESGYLVGVMAGLVEKKGFGPKPNHNTVGSVGGLKIPPVDRYIAGYQYGAKKADPGIKTLNDYSQDFVAQAKCKEKALNQIAQGSVVEFQVAGQCGLGVLDAARSHAGVYGIGVDADQGYLGRHVMTSALKKVDVAVYSAISGAKAGTAKGGTNAIFGAKVDGVGYGKWSPKVSYAIRNAVAKQYKLLKAGKIKGIPATVK